MAQYEFPKDFRRKWPRENIPLAEIASQHRQHLSLMFVLDPLGDSPKAEVAC
jgi:hypothetical protein